MNRPLPETILSPLAIVFGRGEIQPLKIGTRYLDEINPQPDDTVVVPGDLIDWGRMAGIVSSNSSICLPAAGSLYLGKTVLPDHTPQNNGEVLDLGFIKVIDTGEFRGG
jgi:hypothetical protein